MSYLTRATFMRSSLAARPVSTRAFHMTSRKLALSEDDHHDDSAARKQKIDEHKNESVNNAKGKNGQWKRELASNSEAAVKADRDETPATEENISKLQKESSDHLAKKK